MKHRTTLANIAVAMIAGTVCADNEPFADWAAFDAWVESSRDCSRFAGALYPPGMSRVGEYLGILTFDPDELPELDALPEEILLGAHGHRIFLWDDGTTPVQWTVRDSTGAVLRVLFPTNAFDPDDWVESEYGTPPSWLSGEAIENWYSDRSPSRIVPSALLMSTNEWAAYHAALLAAAATNVPVDHSTPVRPSATNTLAFAAFTMGPNGVPSGWLYSPWPTRPHAVFRKETLDEPLWEPAIELVPDEEFAAWSDVEAVEGDPPLRSLPGGASETGFFSAAEVATDSDGDGIPDGMEILAHGSSPWLSDTDGDGISDYDEVHRYGTNPALVDTNGDGIPDNVALNGLLDPNGDDYDGDGLTDAEERLIYMTKTRNADTDGDGLSDYEEIVVYGTSPFTSDTEGDGLSDRREVIELGSNPLSWDTDGDGIDDYKEYGSSNYGLDILDPSDTSDDYDGDGFSDSTEIAWGWSHITRAVSNGTPRTTMLLFHPGEYPRYRYAEDHSIVALGRNGMKRARLRIPKSTQIGTNTMARSLHWTAAPGIHIGNTELSSAGSLAIPDENTELDIWANPNAGGAESRLSLINASGTTNAHIYVCVPRMNSARLYLSSTQSTYYTNLVRGVTGVVCIPADDPLFEKPRASIDASFSPDTATGHRSLTFTDFPLARISGATPTETLYLNYFRWDGATGSSSGPRRGFELEPGLSRLDIGIDFSLDGELDADEIALSCDIYVVPVRLSCDTDRDGAITPADRAGRKQWQPNRGALFARDQVDGAAEAYRGIATSPLSILQVESSGVPLPNGWNYALSTDTGSIRFYEENGSARLPYSSGSVTNGFDNIALAPARFYISSDATDGTNAPFSTRTITLRLKKGVSFIGSDSVVLKSPPVIVPWNTLPLRTLYTSRSADWTFPANIVPGLQFSITNSGTRWIQDTMQAGGFQTDALRGWASLVLDLNHSQENNMVDKLPAEVGRRRTETLCRLPVPNGGNGGNVEATPPLPGFPFGRLMTLVPLNGNVCSAIQFLEKQGIQGPAIRLPGEWLEVRHVDEVCCFVDERTALVPSPRLAFDLISEQVRLHAGNYEDTFVWGLDPTDYVHRMQDILFKRVITNALWNATLSDSATEISGADIAIHIGDYILCDDEVMYVSAKSTSGGTALYTLERDRLGDGSQSHAPDAMLMVLSDWSTANIIPDSGQSVQEKIQRIRQKLLEQIPDISFVEAPVFYCYADYGFVAGSPNIVNGIVHSGTVFLPDPGCALFRNAVQLSGKQFVGGPEEWAGFHCYEGEIHCGSEAERILPAEPVWWDKSRFPSWPHQGSPRP